MECNSLGAHPGLPEHRAATRSSAANRRVVMAGAAPRATRPSSRFARSVRHSMAASGHYGPSPRGLGWVSRVWGRGWLVEEVWCVGFGCWGWGC
jgi:hypothetical protein